MAVDSFAMMKFSYRRSSDLRVSHRYPSTRSYKERSSLSRLFSTSDFSSHPYSVYYGTSGSTAKQNFSQNDDINDVYGYNPDFNGREETFDDHGPRGLRSMQDNPLMDGRRGARIFSGKYDEDFYRDSRALNERDRLFDEEIFMEDQHMMSRMDSIVHERNHLRRKLDSVVNENIYLQNQHDRNRRPQFIPRGENQNYPPTNPMSGTMNMGQNQATKSAIDSVMDELKNMQRTVQAVEAEQQRKNPNGAVNSEISTVDRIKSDLRNMEQELENLSSEKEPFATFPKTSNGYDPSMCQNSGAYNFNGRASTPESEQPTVEYTSEDSGAGNVMSGNGSVSLHPGTHHFEGQYEVVIKAELKKKNSFEGTRDPVEKQIDANKGPLPSGETFGSKYI